MLEFKIRAKLLEDKKTTMFSAYTMRDEYVGGLEDAIRFMERGIQPELASPTAKCCSIGWCEKEQKYYGWSHRAMYGFKVGDVVDSNDHICASSGYTDEYLKEHPEESVALNVGFVARNLEDCRRMAVAFAESVS